MRNTGNIFLVGLMGAGKTTVGRALARQLDRVFFDTDHEIVARNGVSITTIFEIEGEAGFRRREAEMLAELTGQTGIVLATGGGVVLDPLNRARLVANGWVVYLRSTPQHLYERLRHDRARPLLQVADPLQRLQELHDRRDPLYREVADRVVDGNAQEAKMIVQTLMQEARKRC